MPTLFDPSDLTSIQERIGRLRPDARPRWGRLTAPEMVTHVCSACQAGLGELATKPIGGILSRPPFNWFVIHVMPWPKGKAQSPPEFLVRRPASWDTDLADLQGAIARLAAKDPAGEWPASPGFGRISGSSWGVLMYRHLDYHLQQFGV